MVGRKLGGPAVGPGQVGCQGAAGQLFSTKDGTPLVTEGPRKVHVCLGHRSGVGQVTSPEHALDQWGETENVSCTFAAEFTLKYRIYISLCSFLFAVSSNVQAWKRDCLGLDSE